jgi:hypothetical protein
MFVLFRENGNQSRLITLNTKENGSIQKLITQNILLTLIFTNMMKWEQLDSTFGRCEPYLT